MKPIIAGDAFHWKRTRCVNTYTKTVMSTTSHGKTENGEKETSSAVPDDQFAFLKLDSSECRRRVADYK